MNIFDFESKLYNLLLNHLNEQYNFDDYIELLSFENNSILNYILSHAYFITNDDKNAKKYLDIARELNSNFTFEDDYKNISLYIYYLFSTITTQESPFIDDEIDKLISSNPTTLDYIKASEKYRDNNDIGNAVRITNLGINKYPNEETLKYDLASNLLYSRNIYTAWKYNELRFDFLCKQLPQFIDKPKFELQNTSSNVYVYPVTKLGDTIFFSRYLIKLKQDYPDLKIFVRTNPALKTLFVENGINVCDIFDKSIIDYQISFENLPNLYKDNSKILTEGYLKSNQVITQKVKERYFNNTRKKIGIVWRTSKTNDTRNISLSAFENILKNNNLQIYSLQKETTLQEELYLSRLGTVNIGIKTKDFLQTASIIDNLDLVIGCDTSVTNLSGAMGKETILIVPHHSDWRWGIYEEKSEWYNSIKIYRQNQINDITEVFNRVEKYLTQLKSSV